MQYTFSDWRPGDQRVYISDIRKAKKDLAWAPQVRIPEGLKILHTWVKENKHILLGHSDKQTLIKPTALFDNAMSKNFDNMENFPVVHQ
jgi:dTDP-D-glucose 4,6-dehydratase